MSPLARDIRIATSALVALTFIAVAMSLYFLRPVLVPFVLALFLASGLKPLLDYLERILAISRVLALAVALAVSFLVTMALWSVIFAAVSVLIDKQGQYYERLDQLIVQASDRFRQYVPIDVPNNELESSGDLGETDPSQSATNPNGNLPEGSDESGKEPTPAERYRGSGTAPPAKSALDKLTDQLLANSQRILQSVLGELYALVANGVLVMIFLFFLLLGAQLSIPEDSVWSEIEGQLRSYIVTKSVISLFTGLAFGISLWLFDVPMAIVFGLLGFLLNFIPNIGPIVASLLPVPLLVLDPNFTTVDPATGEPVWMWGKASLAFAASGFVQFASGNLVEPPIMGDRFKLHPVVILLSLIFWSIIWGIPGAFLAVPITSALKIVLYEGDHTRPTALLMEGNLAAVMPNGGAGYNRSQSAKARQREKEIAKRKQM